MHLPSACGLLDRTGGCSFLTIYIYTFILNIYASRLSERLPERLCERLSERLCERLSETLSKQLCERLEKNESE